MGEFYDLWAANVNNYGRTDLLRMSVKPGITGSAQVTYRYGGMIVDASVKLEYDLYYLKNFSFGLDLHIMFHKMKTRGAY